MEEIKNSPNCLDCGACCRFVEIPIDGLDEDSAAWLEMHEGLRVRDGKLFIFSKCKNLNPDNTCKIYENRPKICRDFKVGGKQCQEARKVIEIE